jgi:hypothetical protein
VTKVFLGGSRQVSRLNDEIRERLKTIIKKNLSVIVGDANGADKAMQTFLYKEGYRNVEVFCSGHSCRNNVGNWKTNLIESSSQERNFSFYAAKDRIMASETTFGLMIWDGKSVGTLLNVWRLLKNQKKVVVYIAPERQFLELKGAGQWPELIAKCDTVVRENVKRKASEEAKSTLKRAQTSLSFE